MHILDVMGPDVSVSQPSLSLSAHAQPAVCLRCATPRPSDAARSQEWHDHTDDNAFTNAGVQAALRFAADASEIVGDVGAPAAAWRELADRLVVIQNKTTNVTAEYDHYDGGLTPHGYDCGVDRGMYKHTCIKQADTVLLQYPLGYNQSDALAARNLDYYGPRVDLQGGPAMTFSVHTIGYLRVGQRSVAASMFNRSFQDNVREPFAVWDEVKVGKGADHFTTGPGGFLQAITHGYGGLTLGDEALTLRPSLPEGSHFLKLRRFSYLGVWLSLEVDASELRLEALEADDDGVQSDDDDDDAAAAAADDDDDDNDDDAMITATTLEVSEGGGAPSAPRTLLVGVVHTFPAGATLTVRRLKMDDDDTPDAPVSRSSDAIVVRCRSDCTAQLQAAMFSAASHIVVERGAAVSGPLVGVGSAHAGTRLIANGSSQLIELAPGLELAGFLNYSAVYSPALVTLEVTGTNLTIRGHGNTLRRITGSVSGANVTIEGLRLEDPGWDGLYVRGATGLTLRRCTFDRPYRNGISVIDAVDMLVEDCSECSHSCCPAVQAQQKSRPRPCFSLRD
eukprot:COSAG01_NODE_520_length_16006_cov_6.454077_15_plen_564_part_00